MENEELKKMTKAKLYNLKSGIEGILQMLDKGVMAPGQAMEGMSALTMATFEEYQAVVERLG